MIGSAPTVSIEQERLPLHWQQFFEDQAQDELKVQSAKLQKLTIQELLLLIESDDGAEIRLPLRNITSFKPKPDQLRALAVTWLLACTKGPVQELLISVVNQGCKELRPMTIHE
eukprot:TRINITY_DN12326_c3_g2_i1.p3 TRINITY_DN12326_c3_g2~~TRINITY_DN12326_c3_g2_i1.p3  ORF type:complete len:114 (+),score=25.03 TRINITY_DN12326_c3_g2_i1:4032-4373(+)